MAPRVYQESLGERNMIGSTRGEKKEFYGK